MPIYGKKASQYFKEIVLQLKLIKNIKNTINRLQIGQSSINLKIKFCPLFELLSFHFFEGLPHFWEDTFTVFLFASLILNKWNFLDKKCASIIFKCVVIEESKSVLIVVVQSLSHVQLFVTPWTVTLQASLACCISEILVKSMSVEMVMLKTQSYQLIL